MKSAIGFCFFLIGTVPIIQGDIIQYEEFTIDLKELTSPIITPNGNKGMKIEHVKAFDQQHIVEGLPAVEKQFPYQAALFLAKGTKVVSFCGGSLISRKAVLTAAHCLTRISGAVVCVGCRKINEQNEVGKQIVFIRDTKHLIIHEDYNEDTLRNDIALVQLPDAVTLNEYVQTISLAASSTTVFRGLFEGKLSTASGWGKTKDNDKGVSPVLKYIDVNIQNQNQCHEYYYNNVFYEIDHRQVCTEANKGRSTCEGDSGGPLVIKQSGKELIQVGVVSFGISSCEKSAPSVYTRVSSYNSWIKSHIS